MWHVSVYKCAMLIAVTELKQISHVVFAGSYHISENMLPLSPRGVTGDKMAAYSVKPVVPLYCLHDGRPLAGAECRRGWLHSTSPIQISACQCHQAARVT